MEAPICTTGQPRPTDAPESKPSKGKNSLARLILKESKPALCASVFWVSRTALIYGMPLLSLPGKKRNVSHEEMAKPTGGATN